MARRRFEARSELPGTAGELFDWHARPGAFERLAPGWEPVRLLERTGGIDEGARTVVEMRAGPLRKRWVAVHGRMEPGRSFLDRQASGPFAFWEHLHEFLAGPNGCVLRDAVEYQLPLSPLSDLVAGGFTRRKLERLFTHRHLVTRSDLQEHGAFADQPRLRIAVTGASGLVGRPLCGLLSTGGHEVLRLVRRKPTEPGQIYWNPDAGEVDHEGLEGVDVVVHLAGESIASGRWTASLKRRIRDSRVQGTRLLDDAFDRLRQPPKALVCASAVGYYGNRGDAELDEDDPPAEDFLGSVCHDWEEAAIRADEEFGMRVARLRIGVVLAAAGGALDRMLPLFRAGLGGRVGSGDQFWSWIGLHDLVRLFHRAILDEGFHGVYNATSPEPATNKEFTRVLASVLKRPALFPAPAAMLRLALGEMADALLLASARVLPRRTQQAGFEYDYPDLASALRFELGLFDGRFEKPEITHA